MTSSDQILYSGIGALAGALALLYRRLEAAMKTCEDDRRSLWQAVVTLQVKDCNKANCPNHSPSLGV